MVMKKLFTVITLVMCVAFGCFGQIVSSSECKHLSQNARVVNSYDEINENDSIIDLRNLGFGYLICPTCIKYICKFNNYSSLYSMIAKKTNKSNLDNMIDLYNNNIDEVCNECKHWINHQKGSNCRRHQMDIAMYSLILSDVNHRVCNSIDNCHNAINRFLQ